MIAIEGARRLGFSIHRLKDPSVNQPDVDWLDEEITAHRKFAQRRELQYDR
jgi:hypothetical protein